MPKCLSIDIYLNVEIILLLFFGTFNFDYNAISLKKKRFIIIVEW